MKYRLIAMLILSSSLVGCSGINVGSSNKKDTNKEVVQVEKNSNVENTKEKNVKENKDVKILSKDSKVLKNESKSNIKKETSDNKQSATKKEDSNKNEISKKSEDITKVNNNIEEKVTNNNSSDSKKLNSNEKHSSVKESSSNSNFMSQVESEIFRLVNIERKKAGVNTLSYSNTMQKYARMKSEDMAVRKYFDHRDPQGNLITEKMKNDGVKYSSWGENIAYIGGESADVLASQFMRNWMNSPGHRANILSPNFTGIGVGAYKTGNTVYATQEFYS